MKYYTKEWYELMQRQHYTSGLTKIPDKIYSDQEIQAFYDHDLQKEIEHDRKFYETGSYTPADTISCFQDCYKKLLRYGGLHYPQWIRDTIDKRLLALNRMPALAYDQLRKEELANRRAFQRINQHAAEALQKQNIPEEIRSQFHFHDADLLALKKAGHNYQLTLRKDGGWPEGTTPYIKITFQNVHHVDREKGFALRPRRNKYGELCSSCQYLYDELYKTDDGYEVHILLWTPKALRYLTIHCEDIRFDDNIIL